MGPPPKVILAYLHFTYVPNGSFKIHKRHNVRFISDFMFSRYDWAKAVLDFELVKVAKAPDIKFSEWRFESSNVETFRIGDNRFDKFIIFLGEDLVHWSFHNEGENALCIEGNADLPLSYCSCCLHQYYENIITGVKQWIRNNNIKPVMKPNAYSGPIRAPNN